MTDYEYRFTFQNLEKVGYVLLGLAYVGIMFMLIVGTSCTNWRKFDQPVNSSFLLFPGRSWLVLVDMAYLVALAVSTGVLFHPKLRKWCRKNKTKLVSGIPVCILTFHLAGNFHYFFYSCINIIRLPNKVTFGTMFDIRTFLLGPAGIILLTSPCWIAYCLFMCGRKLLFKRVPVANILESREQELHVQQQQELQVKQQELRAQAFQTTPT